MQTRRFRRFPIDLSTLVTAKGHVPQVCRLRDFCQGGMLLAFSQKTDISEEKRPFQRGDLVDIRFTVEVSGNKKRLHLHAKIARSFDDRFGVSFVNAEAEIVGLLAQLAGGVDPTAYEAIPHTQADPYFNPQEPVVIEQPVEAVSGEDRIQATSSLRSNEDVVKAKRVLGQCRRLAEDKLLSQVDSVLGKISDDAMKFSDQAGNNQLGQQIFEFLSHLKSHKSRVKSRFKHTVEALFDYLEGRPIDPELAPTLNQYRDLPTDLELVGQDDFNDWVSMTAMVSRAENTHADPLYEILQRFTELTGIKVDKDNNPIGPSVLANAFIFATDDIETTAGVKDVVYDSFETHYFHHLREFYRELNQLFVQQDVLPSIDYEAPVVPSKLPRPVYEEVDDEEFLRPSEKQQQAREQAQKPLSYVGQAEPPEPSAAFAHPSYPSNNDNLVVTQPESAIQDQLSQQGLPFPQAGHGNQVTATAEAQQNGAMGQPSFQPMPLSAQGLPLSQAMQPSPNEPIRGERQLGNSPEQNNESVSPPMDGYANQTFQQQATLDQARQSTTAQPKGKNLFSIARNLLNISSWGKGKAKQSTVANQEGSIDSGTFIEAILKLQDQERASGQEDANLSERVYQAVARETGETNVLNKVGEREQEVVQVVDTLLENISDDRTLTDNTKEWIHKLEVPFLKAALIDPTVFSGNDNPISEMVNLLEKSGSVLDDDHPGSQRVKHSINGLLDKLLNEFDWDLETFTRISSQLSTLMEPHLEANTRMLNRVVETCQGQQKLVDAKEGVNQALEGMLGGKRIPKLVLLLIRNLWRHLLQQSYLRDGHDSESWKNHLKILQYLLNPIFSTEGEQATKRNRFVVATIAKEMETGSSNPIESEKILNNLKQFLESGGKETDWVKVPKKWSISEVEKLPLTQEETLQSCPNDIPEDKWQAWVEDVCDLQVNDWMMFLEGDYASKPVKLAWVGKKFRQFVFVNRMGKKIVDHTLPKLALLFGKGKLIHLDDYDQPLIDRASEAMLEKLHKKIAIQANTDPLTGLLNRRGFGIRMRQMIRSSQKEEMEHVLCQLDIDQFKLINDAVNYQAGDKYLQEFAKLIRMKGGGGAIPARLGNDTFGLILENCSLDKGKKLLERVRWVLQKFRFPVKETHISLTLSIGLTLITSDKENPTQLLKEADAACASAKSAGGNQLVVFEPDNEDMSKNYRLAYVLGNLVDALEKNNFELMYQEMLPVRDAEHEKSMFEVTLQVKDNPEKTEEYLRAAERYHRIPELDRWLITHLLDWMSRHPRSFAEVSCACVKLSGSSLNDPSFIPFLVKALEKNNLRQSKICFQLTETSTISDLSLAKRHLTQIKETGCLIMLDDFGAGASSFANLKKLPVDYIRVSPTFIQNIDENGDDYALVRSINDVGRFLGKKIIASSVDKADVRDVLEEMGLDYLQGEFIAEKNLVNSKRPPILLSDMALV